jgi:hypothetical protein
MLNLKIIINANTKRAVIRVEMMFRPLIEGNMFKTL